MEANGRVGLKPGHYVQGMRHNLMQTRHFNALKAWRRVTIGVTAFELEKYYIYFIFVICNILFNYQLIINCD